jgi:class 3 adenylate cyclase/tetratricopeptide (TPR) repeat protein
MTCERCGADNRQGRRFCRSCGSPLAATCPGCGAPAEPGDRFCGSCGGPLPGGPEESPDAAAASAPPGADPALSGRAAGAAPTERRIVSVLFADLVGFTALSDDRDPEAVREFLDGYFSLARERIGRYGGTIEKFIGDAVMAVWGTPVAHEDDAERAVRAALDLVDAVTGLTAPDGSRVAARAAVLSGEAAVAIGAKGQGMVAGDLVNTASRLQAAAPPGSVLVGEATVRATESAIVYESAGETLLKGKALAVPAWLALRVVAGRKGAGRSGRLEPPFVGRDDQLRLLKELFHATARERRPRLVSVTGIGGIGKSRLAWELEKYIDGLADTVYWHQGRSPAYGEGLAFWALAEMVRGRLGITEADDPPAALDRLRSSLVVLITETDERERVESRLAGLLGLAPMPPGDAAELYAAWRAIFERLADQAPTILVFEDLHWADPGLLDFIEALLIGARGRPILVVTLARPELLERRPTWGAGQRNFTALDLGPLHPDEMELLLVGLVPGLPQAAIRTIRDRAEGIPLYAVETVRMLLDQGRLTETGGRYRLAGELGRLAVPETLAGLLGARLDGLPEPDRVLLGHAAVLGHSFTVEALVAAMERSEGDLRLSLEALCRAELLELDVDLRSAEQGQYRFVQGLLREVLSSRLSRRERMARHAAAADWFAARGEDEVAEIVAEHRLEALRAAGDDPGRAAFADAAQVALLTAADRASALHATARTVDYLESAADLAADPAARMALRERAADAAGQGTDIARADALARDVLAWHRERGDRLGIARGSARLAWILLYEGRPQDARAELTAGLEVAGADSDEPEVIRLSTELARANMMSGEPAGVLEMIDRILPRAERLDLRAVIADLLVTRAWAVAEAGRFHESIAVLHGALRFAERGGFTTPEFRARMNLSAWAGVEDPREAMEIAFAGVDHARHIGNQAWAISLLGNAGGWGLLVGEWDRVDREAAAEADIVPESPWQAAAAVSRAEIAAHRGDDVGARAALDWFRALVGDSIDPQVVETLRGLTAEVDALAGRDEAAIAGFEQLVRDARPGQDLSPTAVYLGRIAIWKRDRALVDRAIGLMEDRAAHGRFVRAELAILRAAAAALAAHPEEARRHYEAGLAVFRAQDLPFRIALAQLDRATLLPADPDAEAARDEAVAILRRLGAVPFLRRAGIETPGQPGMIGSAPEAVAAVVPTSPSRSDA